MKNLFLFLMAVCISVAVQAQISKTITDLTPGELFTKMSTLELYTVTNLTLSGTIDARDFKTMRDNMLQLAVIDLTQVNIAEYTGGEGTHWNMTYPVNFIPERAFLSKISLTSVTLPNSITSIEKEALNGCSNLYSVNIPSSVTNIKAGAFFMCSLLTSIYIPASVIEIGSSAFSGCSANITVDSENSNYSNIEGVLFNKTQTALIQCPISKSGKYTIPSSVKIINEQAFSYCKNLTSVILPNSVTTIEISAFSDCYGLKSVSLPNSLTEIGVAAFQNCPGLTSVSIPNSISIIGNGAFAGCENLLSINIPASVLFLEDVVFQNCTKLASIYAYSTIPAVLPFSSTFSGVDKNTCALYVPAGSMDLYKAANVWKDFTKIEALITSTDKEIKTDLVTVWPNPAKDLLTINAEKGSVSIYNYNGKLEITQSLEYDKLVNIGSLTPGMYLVLVNGICYKIIKD